MRPPQLLSCNQLQLLGAVLRLDHIVLRRPKRLDWPEPKLRLRGMKLCVIV